MAMKETVRRMMKLVPSLLLMLVLGTAMVLAQPGPRGGPGHEPGMGPGSQLHRVLDELSLTADQQAAIDKIFSAHRGAADDDREAHMAVAKALRDQIQAETFDEAAIRQAAAAVAEQAADRAVAEAKLLHEIRAVLTPEQRVQLQQGLAKNEEMRGPAPR